MRAAHVAASGLLPSRTCADLSISQSATPRRVHHLVVRQVGEPVGEVSKVIHRDRGAGGSCVGGQPSADVLDTRDSQSSRAPGGKGFLGDRSSAMTYLVVQTAATC
jgi:hypothetical protein